MKDNVLGHYQVLTLNLGNFVKLHCKFLFTTKRLNAKIILVLIQLKTIS